MLPDWSAIIGRLKTGIRRSDTALQPEQVRGSGVRSSPGAVRLDAPDSPPDVPRSFRPRWFLVTGHARDGANLRWIYGISEAYKSAAGYNGWSQTGGGLTITTSSPPYAYNANENINGTAGLTGAGVNQSNLVGTYTLIPIPNGTPVLALPVGVSGSGLMEWWIYGGGVPNGVDGQCPS